MSNPNLWTFALACYARPGVEAACLKLQSQGADICLLLCATWLQMRGVAYDTDRRDALEQRATPWRQHVIQPLRGLRQDWRPLAEQDAALHKLREALKTLELEAERNLLERLQAASSQWPADGGTDEWLDSLAPVDGCRAALETLRCAAAQTQLELDGT